MKKFSFTKPLAMMAMAGATVASMSAGMSGVVAHAATSGNVIVGGPTNVTSLDPTQWAGQILVDQGTILEGLYGYNQKNQIVPKIATGYKISNGGKTWTFTLRKNAKWSNGDPVTAQDFYYAWMRQLDPSDSAAQIWASVLNYVLNGYAYHAGGVPKSAVGLKVINNYTLQITTQTPHDILGELAMAASMPLDPKVVQAHPTNWYLPQYFVGDAPYVVKSFQTNGPLVLVKNPKYVGHAGEVNAGNAKQITIIPSPTVPVEDFMAGKMDVAQITSTADLQYVMTHPALKAELHSQPTYNITYMQYDNSTQASPLTNAKVREAIAMALQRAPIVNKVLDGMGGITNIFATPGWGSAKYQKGIPENVTKAQQLLKEAGYPGGKGIPTLYIYCDVQTAQPNGVPTAEAIQQELQTNLGIQTKIVPLAATQYGALTYGGPLSGIKPGFNIAVSAVNSSDPSGAAMGGNQGVIFPGTYGYSMPFVQHVEPWYNNPFDPTYVKEYGNPNDPKMGVSASDWVKLRAVAAQDIPWLNKYYSKLPQPYRSELVGPIPLETQWTKILSAYQSASTAAAKHTAWVAAWEFLFPYSSGMSAGSMNLSSLEVQKYWYSHISSQVRNWIMWDTEFQNETNSTQANQLAGKLMTQVMQQGWTIPIYYNKTFFLERSNVTGAQANPWAWGNFYQEQYLSTK